MTKLEINIGDALFAAEIDFDRSWPTKRWQDTTHFHADFELHIMLCGSALIEIDGRDAEIGVSDVCLLAPRSSHYPKTTSRDLEKANFTFALMQNYHAKGDRSFSEYSYYTNIFKSVDKYFAVNDTELVRMIRELMSERFSPENEHLYKAQLAVFFINLAKRVKEHNKLYKDEKVDGTPESENVGRQRRSVEAFFQNRYNESISIEDLAKELCLSVPHTHRIVKKFFDGGFKKTLMKQRIEHACMLIKQGDLTLCEIAFRSGYTSYNGFLAAFKNYMGKSPRDYEKSIR